MKIGRHEVRGEIGRGGMGVVYRAVSPDGSSVAIKVLTRQDGDRLQRFDREWRLLEELGQAEGFVPLLEVGWAEKIPFIVMPFVAGGTLRDRLRKGPLPVSEAVSVVRALALALGRAHARGIVHRDMKPENCIFGADGRPLVLDLGLAKHFRREPGTPNDSLSKTGETLGTFAYMAPEQQQDARHVDARADVFSLGAILYECLTGEPAFTGETVVELVAHVLAGDTAPLEKVRPETPRWLAVAVERALSVDPATRFADGSAFAASLAPAAPPRPRSRLAVGALALSAIAVGAGGAVLLRGARGAVHVPSPPPPVPPAPPPARPLYESRAMRSVGIWGSYAGRHAAMVEKVRFSPDGKLIASCGVDAFVHIWDASDLAERHTFGGHTENIGGLAFTPDGKRVVTGSKDHTVRVWDLATGRALHVLEGHTEGVNLIAVSSDGKRVLSAGDDKRLGLWDLDSGALVRWIPASGVVTTAAFLPDGTALASVGQAILVFDLERGVVLRAFDHQPDGIANIDVTRDGRLAVTGSDKKDAYLWDVATGKLVRVFRGHEGWTGSSRFSPDGAHVLTGSFDTKARIFSTETGELERTIDPGSQWVLSASWSPDGKRIATGTNDGSVRLWDAATGEEKGPEVGTRGPIAALAVTEDGRRAVTAHFDRSVRLWDVPAGRELGPVCRSQLPLLSLAISADGRRALAGGGQDLNGAIAGELQLCDLDAGASEGVVGPKLPVRALAFAPDERTALSVGFANSKGEGEVFLWQASPGSSLDPMKHGTVAALTGLFLDEGAVLGTARGLELWDTDGGTVSLVGDPGDPVISLARRGSLVVAGRQSGKITVGDMTGAVPAKHLEGHARAVHAVALAPDKKCAVSASSDGVLRLWSLDGDGSELDRLDLASRGDLPWALAFEPGGKTFLVGTRRGVVLRVTWRGP